MVKPELNIDTSAMESFFNPRSIAIIGASEEPSKPSARVLNALLQRGYGGKIFGVNPRYQEVRGVPCYPSLAAIPGDVEMVIISIPAGAVLGMMEECVAKGVKNAVVFTSGFGEVGPEGKAIQDKMADLAKKGNMRILGPNCIGIINIKHSVMASFANIVDLEPVYPISMGFVTQSGAFGAMIYMQASQEGIGFSCFISVGNEADTDFCDFLAYLLDDPETKVIGGYLEGAKDGKKFRTVAEEALRIGKPILMLKVGRSTAGSRAASSHTGALAGDDQIYDAFFRQMGIIRIETLSELTSFVEVHRGGHMPEGNNIAILSASGGAGVWIADKCEALGLNVPEITGETRRKLEEYLPFFGSAKNPIDTTAAVGQNPAMLGKCIRALLADDNIHMLTINIGFADHNAEVYADDLIDIFQATTKPILLVTLVVAPTEIVSRSLARIKESGVTILKDPLFAVQAMSNLSRYADKVKKAADPKNIITTVDPEPEASALLKTPDALSEYHGKKVLGAYGIPITREGLVQSADEAVTLARELGYPVVMKIQSLQIQHKTESGGIKLNLSSEREVRIAYENILANVKHYMPSAAIQGVLVQEMLTDGVEVIIGVTEDPVFGHAVMFGLGGIFVEALKDVSFRLAPLTRKDAEEMVKEIKGYRVLLGMRGKAPVDVDALVDVILRVSQLVTDHGDRIKELDINPLVVFPKGAKVVDALIVKK
ncbi:MAG: acetate--CoA ligase family protein [Deltaproteobacteria bacterium]|nr:acetate--CoA ligase family protein [Deltaproteobacteria bacterium]